MAKQTKLRRQQLRRIHDIISRAEKKGYSFGSFKEEYKSYSTQKLKSLTAPQVKSFAEYIPNFSDIILKTVEGMIAEAEALRTQLYALNAMDLHTHLVIEINEFGRDKVALALENNPDDAIAQAERAIYTSDAKAHRDSVIEFIMLITGTIPSIDESKQISVWEDSTETYYDNPFLK